MATLDWSLEKDIELGENVNPAAAQPSFQPRAQAPSDRLYSLYVDEAEKYDSALAARLKTSSDSLLIFAGLFSATVTALLIESYTSLMRDPGDESVFYLVQIAQQLAANQSTSAGAGKSTPLQFTPYPTFESPAAAIRVNILWVLSLIVSLACALGATLIQSWTNRYTRLVSQFANVSHRAQQREFYFEGLKQSQLIVVAEALPALLHLSLFLFLAGLVEFFFQVNTAVAYGTLGATIAVSSAYALLTFMPLMFASSPYQTPLSVRVPKRFSQLIQRHMQRYQRSHLGRVLRSNRSDDANFSLRQSRALQWLLDRITGVYSFDKFVEGIEPFLGSVADSTRIVFQLNVKTDADERRRCLSAHIGYRLHSCVDTSMDIKTRRSQVRAMAGALWNVFIRIQASDMDNNVAPGGTENPDEWRTVWQHSRQWLHPYTLRSLRRLRYDEDPVISIYAICTSVIILDHVLRSFCDQLQGDQVTVPRGWGFMQLLAACDAPHVHPDVSTSFEFDVITTCLLTPPDDDVGQKSRAEGTLDQREISSLPRSDLNLRMGAFFGENHVTLTPTHIRNTCHLAALNLLLEHLLSKTGNLQPTVATLDMIQATVKLISVNTNAGGTEEDMQRSFVALLERLFYPNDLTLSYARMLGGRATFALEDIKRLIKPTSETLDHPVWAPKAAKIVYGVHWTVRAEDLVLSDAQSGRVGRVIFDAQPVKSGACYFVCCEDRRHVLDLSGADSRTVLVFGLHGGDNQKWQLLQNGQYWSLRNLNTGTFLGIDSDDLAQESVGLRASNHATAWDIRRIEAEPWKYYIYYPDTDYAITRSSTDSTKAILSARGKLLQWEFGRLAFDSLIKEDVEYFLMVGETNKTLDLSGADRRSILAFPLHGGENQKWKFFQDGEYWVVQNISTGAFLNVDGLPDDSANLIGSYDKKSRWDICPDEAYTIQYNIFYAGTECAAVLSSGQNGQLSLSSSNTTTRIRWKLVECDQLLARPEHRQPRSSDKQSQSLNAGLGTTTLKSGAKYILYCHESNNALDLSGADHITVLIWGFHGGINQKWLLQQDGAHWTVQNMLNGRFLSLDGPVVDDAGLVVSTRVGHWEIRPDNATLARTQSGGPIEDNVDTPLGPRYHVFYAGTQFSLAVGMHQPLEAGAHVRLSGNHTASIKWRLEMIQ